MKYLIAVMLTTLFLVPSLGEAAGLVPCGGAGEPMCTTAHVVGLVAKLINWLISMLGVIAVIALVYAGFRMVVSAGNEGEWTKAKEIFSNVIIGIIIILAAWLIVDTLLKGLTDKGLREWSGDLDVAEKTPAAGGTKTATAGCAGCVKPVGVACSNSNSCTVDSAYATKLNSLVSSSGELLQITEAYPPTRTHQAACHSNGTCTDIVFADRNFTTARIHAFQEAARAAGMRAVYEPAAGGSCAGINNCLPFSKTKSTGNHFSLYMD